jgi:hypothetical protein
MRMAANHPDSWAVGFCEESWWSRLTLPSLHSSGQGVRIISCLLPKQSPWLNPIEPKWVHGKRKIVEPDGVLGARSWPSESARPSGVRTKSIYPLPKMLPDRALGTVLHMDFGDFPF